MKPLENILKRKKNGVISIMGSFLFIALLFVSIGVMQLNIDRVQFEEPNTISDIYYPPPPPPPMGKAPEKDETVEIDFNVPLGAELAEITLEYLNVDFGINSKSLTEVDFDLAENLNNYKTDGLDSLVIYEKSELDNPPQARYSPRWTMPRQLAKSGFSVSVIFRITSEGRVTNLTILSSPFPEANEHVMNYLSKFRYNPPVKDGKKVSCWIRRKINFRKQENAGNKFAL